MEALQQFCHQFVDTSVLQLSETPDIFNWVIITRRLT